MLVHVQLCTFKCASACVCVLVYLYIVHLISCCICFLTYYKLHFCSDVSCKCTIHAVLVMSVCQCMCSYALLSSIICLRVLFGIMHSCPLHMCVCTHLHSYTCMRFHSEVLHCLHVCSNYTFCPCASGCVYVHTLSVCAQICVCTCA